MLEKLGVHEERRPVETLAGFVKRVPGTTRVWRWIKHGTPVWVSPLPVAQARDRGRPSTDPQAVLAKYRASEVTAEPDDFVLYRIIGNDLPPRHELGQARRNLAFILEHEPTFPQCEKRFVVNRIVDRHEEEKILDLLEQADASYFRIPFRWEEYAHVPWDFTGVPRRYAPGSRRHRWLREDEQERAYARFYRHKNNYVMNNNGARNAALAEGRTVAKWIMPWDGNCFLTETAFEEIQETVQTRADVPYWLVRMVRVEENQEAFRSHESFEAFEEPQIFFRRDAALSFDEAFPYGHRPKVELLWRLGVPGPWEEWGIAPWDLPCPDYHADAGAYGWVGWVARLAAAPPGEGAVAASGTDRMLTRTRGIVEALQDLDRRGGPREVQER
jgi:hypothetical protein